MAPAEALRAMHALLSDRSRWTTEVMARDADGVECSPREARAHCWCVYGALNRVTEAGPGRTAARGHLADAAHAMFDTGVVEANDTYGHDGALALVVHALALAERVEIH